MTTTKTVGLSPADVKKLRQPFAVVKFMPQGSVFQFGDSKACRFLAYIDSSLVAERLSEIDPNWHAEYERLGATFAEWKQAGYATVCRLTLNGVTREEIGYPGGPTEPVKAAYSDALKRAALRFHVGSYLRDASWDFLLPEVLKGERGSAKAYTTKQNDKGKTVVSFMKDAGKIQLRFEYQQVLAKPEFKEHYGEALHYGDVEPELADDVLDAAGDDVADEVALSETAIAVLELVASYNGRKANAASAGRWAKMTGPDAFAKALSPVLVATTGHLKLTSEQTEELRTAAQQAAFTEQEEHLTALHDLLKRLDDIPF